MHPGLFELFLIKTGQTDVPGRGLPVPDELAPARLPALGPNLDGRGKSWCS